MEEDKPIDEYNAEEIEEALRDVKAKYTPDILAKWRRILTGEWGFWAGQLDPILRTKADKWIEISKTEEARSVAMTDKLWEASKDGKKDYTLPAEPGEFAIKGGQVTLVKGSENA